MKIFKLISILLIATLLTGCLLSKQERRTKRGNRKLEKLVDHYPELSVQDTLIDTVTVTIEEIRIDTFLEVSKDVSGVDSILVSFGNKIDSLTSLELGDQIKYYITNRQVIEDTIVYIEDGVTVKVYQDGDLIRISVFKPEEEIEKVVKIPYEKIQLAPETLWSQFVTGLNRYAMTLLLIFAVIYVLNRIYKLIRGTKNE